MIRLYTQIHNINNDPLLSIMIPTLPERKPMLLDLLTEITNQVIDTDVCVEVLVASDNKEYSCGHKREYMTSLAQGIYGWHIDDDDMIAPGALRQVIDAAGHNPDVIGLKGIMTTDGGHPRLFEHSLSHKSYYEKDGVYYRYPNHITPMKLDLMRQVPFPDKNNVEDDEWAKPMHERGLLKTEVKVTEPIYLYRYKSIK